ncbi:hypothetical protein [uncultured Marinobacter sp.]|uniref:hypothetical protein n=1 Tax=uncultured Marinobacter sp. TaxID=187379 RepID=UPI0030DA11EE
MTTNGPDPEQQTRLVNFSPPACLENPDNKILIYDFINDPEIAQPVSIAIGIALHGFDIRASSGTGFQVFEFAENPLAHNRVYFSDGFFCFF